MVRYRDPRTGLPLPSYDLWEERWGVHAFTVATVYAGLKAAHNFAVAFGDRERAAVYAQAAEEMKAGASRYLFSPKLNRFVRRLVNRDASRPPDSPTYQETAPLKPMVMPVGIPAEAGNGPTPTTDDLFEVDETIDASLYAIYKFHLFEPEDPRVQSTMRAIEQKLWVRTNVGGVARYENDYYHRVSQDIANVPGNPWFICTLWLADYYIARAKSLEELKEALPIFEWAASHAMESGVLAEQVHPYTNEPLSVSPLTWSHATVVSTAIKYLEKLEELQTCDACHHPIFRLRRRGTVEVKSQAVFGRLDAEFEADDSRETSAAVAQFVTEARAGSNGDGSNGHGANGHDAGPRPVRATLSIDTRDCIGCNVCVSHCDKGVLRMVGGKAMIDLRNLNDCDLDAACVAVCPTHVVALHTEPCDPAEYAAFPRAAADAGCDPELTEEEASSLRELVPLVPGASPRRARYLSGRRRSAPRRRSTRRTKRARACRCRSCGTNTVSGNAVRGSRMPLSPEVTTPAGPSRADPFPHAYDTLLRQGVRAGSIVPWSLKRPSRACARFTCEPYGSRFSVARAVGRALPAVFVARTARD